MFKKKETNLSYTEAVAKMKEEKDSGNVLFTEEELRVLGKSKSTQKSQTRKPIGASKTLSAKEMGIAKRNIILISSAVVVWVFILLFGGSETTDKEVAAPVYVEKFITPTERIESQFSAWDGSHRDFVKRTKAVMNDPSSFEHVSTRYVNKENHIMVVMTYRGKNAFGATILDEVIGFYTLDGTYNGALTQ